MRQHPVFAKTSRLQQIAVQASIWLCCIFLTGSVGYGQTGQIDFDIPSQKMVKALDMFAEKTDFSLMYAMEELADKKNNEITGKLTPDQALGKMLEGTGLAYEFTSDTTVSIRRDPVLTLKNPHVANAPETGDKKNAEVVAQNGSTSSTPQQPGQAAQQPATAPGSSHDDFILEETVVTATKTGETELQKTPIAITAFSAEALKNSGTTSIKGLSLMVPGLTMSANESFAQPYIRGIGTQLPFTGADTSVAVYLDGVYLGRSVSHFIDFIDVERVEVLRGPQGTLYGRNATGGAFNIVTMAPTTEWTGRISAGFGDYSQYRVEGTVSGPIVDDKVLARFSIMDAQHDGYMDNIGVGPDPLDENVTALHGSLQFNISDNLQAVLSGDYSKSDDAGVAMKATHPMGLPFLLGAQWIDDFWTVNLGDPQWSEIELSGAAAKISLNLPSDMAFTSISSFRHIFIDMQTDVDATEVRMLKTVFGATGNEADQFTQEFQLTGKWGRVNWVAGLFYFWEEDYEDWDLDITDVVPDFIMYYDAWNETNAYAAFGQATYQVSDKISLTAGLRYSYEEKDWKLIVSDTYTPAVTQILSTKWDAVTPKFGIDYQVSEEMLLYASITRGFKSGGYNVVAVQNAYDPEFIWSYEIGLKSDWLANRLHNSGNTKCSRFHYQGP
ncbi:MAG: TonB-dependent receptor [Deltaproteobacteria bacterium]|nr:TonB-dependent receptor [Deltaproteobacteria bacterium]